MPNKVGAHYVQWVVNIPLSSGDCFYVIRGFICWDKTICLKNADLTKCKTNREDKLYFDGRNGWVDKEGTYDPACVVSLYSGQIYPVVKEYDETIVFKITERLTIMRPTIHSFKSYKDNRIIIEFRLFGIYETEEDAHADLMTKALMEA